MRPVDPVTVREAALILGCGASTVHRHVLAGRLAGHGDRYEHYTLSRADVERLALEVYDWREYVHDPESYWVTGKAAAALVGVNRARLGEQSRRGWLPFERHSDGTRLYRREQLETVANSRAER